MRIVKYEKRLRPAIVGLAAILSIVLLPASRRLIAHPGWTDLPPLPISVALQASSRLNDGRVFIVGGISSGVLEIYAGTQIFDSRMGTWAAGPNLESDRSSATATTLPNGDVLVVGGESLESSALSTAEICAPSAPTCVSASPMSFGRTHHAAVTLQDGRVLVVGGGDPRDVEAGAVAEIYDVESGSWTPTTSLNVPRTAPSASLMRDGRVIVTGGFTAASVPEYSDSVEIYDPVANRWTQVTAMRHARVTHSSTVLPSGLILVVGGVAAIRVTLSGAEVYDPIGDAWTDATSLDAPLFGHSATLLPDGRVLLIGGVTSIDPPLLSDETPIYDPAADRWDMRYRVEPGRRYHSVVSLQDGRVVIAGGFVQGSIQTASSAAIFDSDTIFRTSME